MSDKKLKINVMDCSSLCRDIVNPELVGKVLETLNQSASNNSKRDKIFLRIGGESVFEFRLEEKILRRDVLELTYRYNR